MIPVEGHKGLYRDEKTNAILNCNDSDYNEYINLKASRLQEKTEIEFLKDEINEIKSLLFKLLDKD
jgi:hypothetical protein